MASTDESEFVARLTASLPKLRAFVRLRCQRDLLQHESTSDLVQSVCGEALRQADNATFANDLVFRSWLYHLAIGKLVDRRRYHSAGKRSGASSASYADVTFVACDDPSPSKALILDEERAAVSRAMRRLSPIEFEVVSMARFFDLPHAAIAKHLGKSEVAVRKVLSRALTRLASLAVTARERVADGTTSSGNGPAI